MYWLLIQSVFYVFSNVKIPANAASEAVFLLTHSNNSSIAGLLYSPKRLLVITDLLTLKYKFFFSVFSTLVRTFKRFCRSIFKIGFYALSCKMVLRLEGANDVTP